ncbi:hypothetical protein SAMN04488104_103716 [Algoriphagus faecimaris]|uniref:Uncharacterized protein n=1 Tax=Algoriphagus faecimaris TaxID=686796 RepID=A0A1G6VPH6_9BACT|nr:hypothetical protein [Algoriphagus faecimaris]SDD55498.1 hypothetical protein SAMN04488104_103716 [Algoriphagus faecimaris]
MKKLILGLLVIGGLWSCTDGESEKYTGKSVEYQLYQSSDFDYVGSAQIQELIGGNLEITLQLEGARSNSDVTYTSHLHFGNYTEADAPIAFMLNPVKASDLRSVTILEQLTDGTRLNFEEIKGFDGHIKVHLAPDGPDYNTILVAGNVGLSSNLEFKIEEMAVCGKDF